MQGGPPTDVLRHARVSMAALRSLYATRAAREREVEIAEIGTTLAVLSAGGGPDINRVLGLGLFHSSGDVADRIERLYGRRGLPFSVQIHPGERSDAVAQDLERLGLREVDPWTVLSRAAEDIPTPPASVVVDRITTPEKAELFASVITEAFGVPWGQKALFKAPVGRSGWSHYIAQVEGEAVGAAWMFVHEGTALFGGSGTLEGWRRRGVQRALTLRRLRDASDDGATTAFIDTQAVWSGEPPAELRAAVAAGFARSFELRSFFRVPHRQRLDLHTGKWI